MKVALVCDWLVNVGGAERVLLEFHKMFPDAPIYTSKYNKKGIDWFKDAEVKTGYLQHFPKFPERYRYFRRIGGTWYPGRRYCKNVRIVL